MGVSSKKPNKQRKQVEKTVEANNNIVLDAKKYASLAKKSRPEQIEGYTFAF